MYSLCSLMLYAARALSSPIRALLPRASSHTRPCELLQAELTKVAGAKALVEQALQAAEQRCSELEGRLMHVQREQRAAFAESDLVRQKSEAKEQEAKEAQHKLLSVCGGAQIRPRLFLTNARW